MGLAVLGLLIFWLTGSGAAAKGGWTLGLSTYIAVLIIVLKLPRAMNALTRVPILTDVLLTLAAFVVFNLVFQGVTATPAAIVFGLLVSASTSMSALIRGKNVQVSA
jgi:hypothetical protein